ncbi:hypothetical protein ATK36_3942 [Amycolatopsis sulphurea]|uniref:Uncharacterized protein n=1 Tax=Amycolatopsis sulphurea TaxID=76022 RepID=A0A2A9FEH2_9PSEU|nr:hypothetical protein ATK36_3942 [Amycolatopsis sulphurea]
MAAASSSTAPAIFVDFARQRRSSGVRDARQPRGVRRTCLGSVKGPFTDSESVKGPFTDLHRPPQSAQGPSHRLCRHPASVPLDGVARSGSDAAGRCDRDLGAGCAATDRAAVRSIAANAQEPEATSTHPAGRSTSRFAGSLPLSRASRQAPRRPQPQHPDRRGTVRSKSDPAAGPRPRGQQAKGGPAGRRYGRGRAVRRPGRFPARGSGRWLAPGCRGAAGAAPGRPS